MSHTEPIYAEMTIFTENVNFNIDTMKYWHNFNGINVIEILTKNVKNG